MSDNKMLKVLSSETRKEILKELSRGYRTPSDLSRILKKSKSTTVEHLEKLMDAGLVSKSQEPGRKWVFYDLTKKGHTMVPTDSNRIILVLALVFMSFAIGSYSLYSYYFNPLVMREVTFSTGEMVTKNIEKVPRGQEMLGVPEDADVKVLESNNTLLLYLSGLMFLVCVLGAVIVSRMHFKNRRIPEA